MKPQDPSKEYQARGMTLITITALVSGPIATRLGDLVIPGQEIAYGGFATLLGFVSSAAGETSGDRDVYTIGTTRGGLQLARVGLNDITDFNKYSFFDPKSLHFLTKPPPLSLTDSSQIYLPGSFSSGNIFFSPYFGTFILIYFNKFVDSTFYIRFLDLDDPRENDVVWTEGGKNGQGIRPEDVEALVKYEWSPEQKLYASPRGQGGFNYAGNAHPEYFNRQYFAKSLYPDHVEKGKRINDWYGSALLTETDAEADGKCLLLSWTAQIQTSKDTGIYQPQLAVLCFDSIPIKPGSSDPPASVTHIGNIPTTPVSPPQSTSTHKSIDMDLNMVPKSWLARGNTLSSFLGHNGYANSGLWDVVGTLMVLFGVVLLGALVL